MSHAPSTTGEVAEIVRASHAAREPLRIEGRGGWMNSGSPAARIRAGARAVSLKAQSGVLGYVPADLTLTARAGTTLAELDAATAPNGQWCPLLAWGDDEGTIGATFATGTSGPCARALGRPRDIALGLEFVDGTGSVVRVGGRVVKNVAGFDLTRLIVGSFGALGIITEVTVRLRARPTVDVTWSLSPRDGVAADTAARAESVRRGEITPIACEPVDARNAKALGMMAGTMLVRFAGNRALVDAARASVSRTYIVADAAPALWTRLRALDPYPRQSSTNAISGSVAGRIKERFDPAGILNPGVLGESA